MTKFKAGQKWRTRNDASAVLDRDELIELICKAIGGGDKVGMVDFHVAEDIADALLARPSPDALDMATKGGGVMGDAPERIQTLDDYGQWATDYDGGVEYIRADLVDAIIAATFDLAEGKCAETLTMFENENPNRPDVMPYIDDACEACGDAIRALNTEETRTAILADAMKGQKDE